MPRDIEEKKYIIEGIGLYCEKYPCVKCIKIKSGTDINEP
jgi:deoxycytidylate deaminase